MGIPTQPLEVNDFSLGVTDYYIDGDQRAAKIMDNLELTPNKKPRTRPGSEAFNDVLPLGNSRVTKFSRLKDTLLVFQDKRAYYDLATVWTEILGPSGGTFMTLGDSNSVIIDTQWQDHVLFSSDSYASIQKAFIDDTGAYRVQNAGLPLISTGYSVTNPAGTGSTYLYAFCLKYTYKVGTLTYIDRGPVFYYPTSVQGGAITTGNGTMVTIPTTYSPTENWDYTNWDIEIYRTVDAGTTFFLVTTQNFGTSSYSDETEDATLAANETLYTTSDTGDLASNGTPPKAKFVHSVNDFTFYANIKDGTEIDETLILQSKAGDADSVPAEFFANSEQPIKGLSSIYDRPMVFCKEYIYRIDNFYADDGTGGTLLRRIDDKAGCVSARSIVRTHLGIFWAGELGFYWSDGFRVSCVSDHLNKSYKLFTTTDLRKKRIVGTFDPSEQKVYWTVCIDGSANEPDRLFGIDLKFPFLPDAARPGATFFTWSGVTFLVTELIKFDGYIYRGDSRGFVLRHISTLTTDPKIDVSEDAVDWQKSTIFHQYSSCFLDFGSKFYRKWVPRILISADNTTNLSIAISSSNDNNRVTGTLKPIRYRSNITWGDELPLWGDPDALWNKQGLIEEWRRFPAGGLRCNYKQVSFTNALVKLFDSDLLGTVTVNAATKTATLGGSFLWPDDLIDYYISYETDNYTKNFLITTRTSTTLVYSDAGDAGPSMNGLYKWIIRGYPKGEVLLLNGYVIHWAYLSKSHTPFSASSLGGTP